MKRVLAVLSVSVLVTVACGGNDAATSSTTTAAPAPTTSSTAAPTSTTSTTSTSTTSTTSTTTTTMAPAFTSSEIAFEDVVPADPDPLETIEPLTGVTLSVTRNGDVGFTFDEVLYGDPTVTLEGLPPGFFLGCSTFTDEGERSTECVAQNPDGFPVTSIPTPAEFPELTAWIPNLSVEGGSITIELDGTTYTGTSLNVEDGPLFVQIDPNTGGLAEPVTRRSGSVSGAALQAALTG